jgi:hypothetical protein
MEHQDSGERDFDRKLALVSGGAALFALVLVVGLVGLTRPA